MQVPVASLDHQPHQHHRHGCVKLHPQSSLTPTIPVHSSRHQRRRRIRSAAEGLPTMMSAADVVDSAALAMSSMSSMSSALARAATAVQLSSSPKSSGSMSTGGSGSGSLSSSPLNGSHSDLMAALSQVQMSAATALRGLSVAPPSTSHSSPSLSSVDCGIPAGSCGSEARRKKSVSFADAVGRCLTQVKLYTTSDLFVVPESAYKNLNIQWDDEIPGFMGSNRPFTYYNQSAAQVRQRGHQDPTTALYSLVPEFTQPGLDFGFAHAVEEKKLSLDRCTVTAVSGNRAIQFDIAVANVAFRKTVIVRYTTNNWASTTDALASYVPGSSNGYVDHFRANVSIPSCLMAPGARLLFAIKFTAGGGGPGEGCATPTAEYWDNNGGRNYSLIFKKTVPTNVPVASSDSNNNTNNLQQSKTPNKATTTGTDSQPLQQQLSGLFRSASFTSTSGPGMASPSLSSSPTTSLTCLSSSSSYMPSPFKLAARSISPPRLTYY